MIASHEFVNNCLPEGKVPNKNYKTDNYKVKVPYAVMAWNENPKTNEDQWFLLGAFTSQEEAEKQMVNMIERYEDQLFMIEENHEESLCSFCTI